MIKKNTLYRYLLFYLTIAVLYTFWSYFFDLLFFRIDYGSTKDYMAVGFEYFFYFIIGYSYIALPICMVYNVATNLALVEGNKWIRYLIAVIIGCGIGLIVGRSGVSYYIGQYRSLKNILLFGMVLLTAELMRDVIVYYRYKDKRYD
jgi:uncharacterized membrane protein